MGKQLQGTAVKQQAQPEVAKAAEEEAFVLDASAITVETPEDGPIIINEEWVAKIRNQCKFPDGFDPNSIVACLRFSKDKKIRQAIFHACPHGKTDRWAASDGSSDKLRAILTNLKFPSDVVDKEVEHIF